MIRSQLDILAVLLVLALMGVTGYLMGGCASSAPRRPLSPPDQALVASAVLEWRDMRLAWAPACERLVARLQVDRDVGRCRGRVWGCLDEGTIHLAPDLEQQRGKGADGRTLIHELAHGLVQCSGLDPYGDVGHLIGIWESAGEGGYLRRAQRRAGVAP